HRSSSWASARVSFTSRRTPTSGRRAAVCASRSCFVPRGSPSDSLATTRAASSEMSPPCIAPEVSRRYSSRDHEDLRLAPPVDGRFLGLGRGQLGQAAAPPMELGENVWNLLCLHDTNSILSH